jgi:modulator of FtsH protease HflK
MNVAPGNDEATLDRPAVASAAPLVGKLPGRRRLHWIGLVAFALIAAYLATGFYTVSADSQAVVRRFGAFASHLGPGMHYRLPWPIDRVEVVKTTSVTKIGVGFALPDAEAKHLEGMELLTGDTNILNVALVVQYVVRDPVHYLFQVQQAQVLVGAVAQSVLTQTVVSMPVDEVLTTGRLAIQSAVKTKAQEILDRYRSGIQITSANIMSIAFDKSVAQAFQEVADAMADREKVQNEAHAYANDQLPKARGEATRVLTEAENYKRQRVAEAMGNSNRFLALLKEYEKAEEVTRARIYIESMEKILPKVKMYVIDSQGGKVPLNLRVTNP